MSRRSAMKNYRGRGRNPLSNPPNRVAKEHTGDIARVLDYTTNQDKLVILREPGRWCPERLFCKLVFTDPVMSRGNVGDDVANWYFQSSIRDPDPNNTGEHIPGYTTLTGLYENFRVHSMTVDVEMYNQNSEAFILAVIPSNQPYTVNSLLHDDILELSGNPTCRSRMCGTQQGTGRARIRTIASGNKLVGPTFANDLDYSGTNAANPEKMYYVNIGICDCVGNMVYNPVFRTRITYEVEFFRPRSLLI